MARFAATRRSFRNPEERLDAEPAVLNCEAAVEQSAFAPSGLVAQYASFIAVYDSLMDGVPVGRPLMRSWIFF